MIKLYDVVRIKDSGITGIVTNISSAKGRTFYTVEPQGIMVPSQAMGTKGYRKDICLIPSLVRLYHALRPGKGAAGVRCSEENTGSGDLGI